MDTMEYINSLLVSLSPEKQELAIELIALSIREDGFYEEYMQRIPPGKKGLSNAESRQFIAEWKQREGTTTAVSC